MKVNTIRRIIGITALVLWAVAISSLFLGEDVRMAYHLDGWAFGITFVLTPIYAVMLTIHIGRGKHWLIKVAAWIVSAIVIYVCGVMLFVSTMFSDHRAWSNKDYVVYSESKGWIDPNDLVLYRRDGFIDKKMYRLRCEDWLQNDKVEYTMVDSLDLVLEEYSSFRGDSIYYHTTNFYRLCNGKRYDKSQNDSLLALINKQ